MDDEADRELIWFSMPFRSFKMVNDKYEIHILKMSRFYFLNYKWLYKLASFLYKKTMENITETKYSEAYFKNVGTT